jgi:chromosome segregation ATPase
MKKFWIAAVAVFLGIVVLKSDAGEKFWTWCREQSAAMEKRTREAREAREKKAREIREAREAKEAPEKRIKQLRGEINNIDGEVKKVVNHLIKMEVARNELRDEVRRLEKQRDAQKAEVKAMNDALEGATAQVTFHNRTYRPEVFQERLDRAVRQLNTTKATLKSRQAALQSKEDSLLTLDRRIQTMRDKKLELIALADKLETKIEELRLKQLENRVDVDDSQVAECEALYARIKRQLEEEELKAEKSAGYGLTPVVETPEKDRKPVAESLKSAREALEDDDAKAPVVGKK